jgi:hypothetical protein
VKTCVGETVLRIGTVLGSCTSGRPAELPKETWGSNGRRVDRELLARGRSTSGEGGCAVGCPYIDIDDDARGGRVSRRVESDPAALVGKGLDPVGRTGRFVRRSFR